MPICQNGGGQENGSMRIVPAGMHHAVIFGYIGTGIFFLKGERINIRPDSENFFLLNLIARCLCSGNKGNDCCLIGSKGMNSLLL